MITNCTSPSNLTDHAALPSNWTGGVKLFLGAFRAGAPSPLACLPRARPFILAPIYFLVPAMQSVVVGALGTIMKDIKNYSNKIPGNINTYTLQKITLLSEVHLLRQALSIK